MVNHALSSYKLSQFKFNTVVYLVLHFCSKATKAITQWIRYTMQLSLQSRQLLRWPAAAIISPCF